jgi:hypothetical protein
MSEHWDQTISAVQQEVAEFERKAADAKLLANQLCKRAGRPPIYADAETMSSGGVPLSIQSDQFYGQPQATCMRTILEMRKALNQGPASVNDLYDALVQGGYQFDTKNVENAKRGLRINLTKNSVTFHKLPNGLFGLTAWYPNVRTPKQRAMSSGTDESLEEEVTEPEADEGESL